MTGIDRRTALRALTAGAAAALAGCGRRSDDGEDEIPIRLAAVDVLNRRSDPETFSFVARRDGDVVAETTRRIDGAADSARPTGVEFSSWAADRHTYDFELSVEDGDALSTTPAALEVTDADVDCVRVVFVLNLDSRLTGYARTPDTSHCETG